MKKLVVIDGHNFLWRAYSVPFEFYSKKNTPLHVISTYLKLIKRAVSSINNLDSMVVVFDTDTANDNSKLLKDYKANRRKFLKGEDCPYSHLPYVKKVLDYLNIGFLEVLNIEADDIIASVVKTFCKKSSANKSYIVSTDSDFYQLLDKQTFIVKLKKGDDYEIINHKHIKDRLGVSPKQYVEFKSLMGDTADNIKGIPGVGPVTAKKIICGDVDFNTKRYKTMLALNKKLITLNCDCEKQWKFRNFFYNKNITNISNREIFKYCDF